MQNWLRTILVCLVFVPNAVANISDQAISQAAEYYFKRRDYKQALELWKKVIKNRPEDVAALLRISEIRLHFEGRGALRETLVNAIKETNLSEESQKLIKQKLTELQNKFLTDEGQSFFSGRE